MLDFKSILPQGVDLETAKALLNNLDCGLLLRTAAPDYALVYANRGFCALTGYSYEETKQLLQADANGLVYPADQARVTEQYEQLEVEGRCDLRYRLVHKDGNLVWVLEKCMLDHFSGFTLLQSVLTDISDLKKTEQELRISEMRYQLAMAFTDLTLFDYDIRTKLMHLHRHDVEEYNIPQVMDNSVETLISLGIIQPRSHATMRALYQRIENGAPSSSAVVHARNENGDEQILEISLATIYDDEGKPVSAVGIKRDMTQSLLMKREAEYVSTLVTGKSFLYEADLTRDRILSMAPDWQDVMRKNSSNISTFTGMIRWACRSYVDPAHSEMVQKRLSVKEIIATFDRGEKLMQLEFRQKDPFANGQYEWYQHTINIIRDEISGNLIVRVYYANINFEKKRELRAHNEQRFYEAMAAKNVINYEVNLTRDTYTSSQDTEYGNAGAEESGSYGQLIQFFADHNIHSEDRKAFLDTFSPEAVLLRYRQGNSDIQLEYRRKENGPSDSYLWVNATMHLFTDEHTGEIKSFCYVEKIDEQKKRQLELLYKSQHDQLTGLLNKATFEDLVSAFLADTNEYGGVSAFLLIDLDAFKDINDTFGHVFGDAVLSRFSTKIYSLFRDCDLVGRVGGDEFAVLMKNARDYRDIIAKAQELCTKVSESYTKGDREITLSCSVGAAFCGIHGNSYRELYQCSDTALYEAKRLGKHRYVPYTHDMHMGSTEQQDDTRRNIFEERRFEDSSLEYILRILYEQPSEATSLDAVLKMIGNHYDLSRVAIFENDFDAQLANCRFLWCAPGQEPSGPSCNRLPLDLIYQYQDSLDDGVLCIPDGDSSEVQLELRKIMRERNVKSMVQFPFGQGLQSLGVVSFEQCDRKREPSRTELSDWRSISLLLGLFVTGLQRQEQLDAIQARKRRQKAKKQS